MADESPVALIDHDTPYRRVWGVTIDGQRYRADVGIMANGNIEPPEWVAVTLRSVPPGISAGDWARVGITQALGPIACEAVIVDLVTIGHQEWARLANADQPNRETRRRLVKTSGGH